MHLLAIAVTSGVAHTIGVALGAAARAGGVESDKPRRRYGLGGKGPRSRGAQQGPRSRGAGLAAREVAASDLAKACEDAGVAAVSKLTSCPSATLNLSGFGPTNSYSSFLPMSFVFSMVVMLVVDDVSASSPAFVFASTSADTSFSPSSLAACAHSFSYLSLSFSTTELMTFFTKSRFFVDYSFYLF